MKQQRISRRQQLQLQKLFAELYADSMEYCDEHLDFLRRRHQQFCNFSGV
jgi:hypothetical protein